METVNGSIVNTKRENRYNEAHVYVKESFGFRLILNRIA